MKHNIREDERYQIDDEGNLHSPYGYIMRPEKHPNGYLRVMISNRVRIRLHRAVAEAFLPNPLNLPMVNHKDGNKHNNNLKNLEWISNKDNMLHAYKKGLIDMVNLDKDANAAICGKNNTKRAVYQCDLQGNVLAEYESVRKAHIATGIQLRGALSGRYATARGFIWRYKPL